MSWRHHRLGVSTTATFSAAGGNIPWGWHSAVRFHCWTMGMRHSGLRWDKRTNNAHYPFVTGEGYKYIQCVFKQMGIKTYCDSMLNEENTALWFPSFKNGDGIQKLIASMPDGQTHGEWELHTLEDMRWSDYHQYPIKYWSRDIIKSIRWSIQQPASSEHRVYTPHRWFNSDPPPNVSMLKCTVTTTGGRHR